MTIEPWVPVFYESAAFGPQDWITAGVGIGGAVLGALVGGWLSSRQAHAARKDQDTRDAAARTEREKAGLLKAQFQCAMILADAESTVASINMSLDKANSMGMTGQPLFTRMMPIVGAMTTPSTDIEAISPLITARENGLVQDYFELHAKHEILAQALTRFDDVKTDLNERVSPFMTWKDGSAKVEITPERQAKLQPFFDSADSLAKQIQGMAEELALLAAKTTYSIGPAGRRIFNDDKFPILVPKNSP